MTWQISKRGRILALEDRPRIQGSARYLRPRRSSRPGALARTRLLVNLASQAGRTDRKLNLRRPERRRVVHSPVALMATASAATLVLLMAIWTPTPKVVWNGSSSVPIGLYRVDRTSKIMADDLVIAMPPEPVAMFLASYGYLPGGVPLIKRVLALGGQTVCRKGLVISVDYEKIGMAQARDSLGRTLPEWQGCRVIKRDEIFLMNTTVTDSFDGRYFGPLPVSSVVGTATALSAARGALILN